MIGGYQIIDLKGTNFTVDVASKVEGIYSLLEGTKKVKLFENFSIAGVEKDARFVVGRFAQDANYFVGGFGYSEDGDVMSIEITSEDMVTIKTTN